MRLGRSGTAGFGPSGTRNTDYWERQSFGKPQESSRNRGPSNSANRFESFGFLLTVRAAVDILAPFGVSRFGQRTIRWLRTVPIATRIPGDSR